MHTSVFLFPLVSTGSLGIFFLLLYQRDLIWKIHCRHNGNSVFNNCFNTALLSSELWTEREARYSRWSSNRIFCATKISAWWNFSTKAPRPSLNKIETFEEGHEQNFRSSEIHPVGNSEPLEIFLIKLYDYVLSTHLFDSSPSGTKKKKKSW